MYNVAISLAIGVGLFGLVALWLGPVAGIVPGIAGAGISLFLLGRRTAKAVEMEMAQVVPLLQGRQIKEAEAVLRGIQERHGRWQFMLEGQIEAQLGMLEYLQMNWDKALPKLEAGKWRNWTAWTCIGCIHYRRGRKAAAWEAFGKAADAAPKEVIIYGVWATLLVRDNERTEALNVVARGLNSQPDSKTLKDLKQKIANKKKIKNTMFGEGWYQFFPEDMAQQMMMRGRRSGMPQAPQPRIGARGAPRR